MPMSRPEIDAFIEQVTADLPHMKQVNDGAYLPRELEKALAFAADLVHPDDARYLRDRAAALMASPEAADAAR